ncbi:Uncharacterised protein [Bordetella pertussis]|nr:Uncharacterised protein [Bordetella pertussis]CFW31878.1 Uncharacterised protein [Bordetella pertussis]
MSNVVSAETCCAGWSACTARSSMPRASSYRRTP